MKLSIRDRKEFTAGLLFLAIGGAWALGSLAYPLGRLTRMGPGYFPLLAALLLAFIGLVAMLRGVRAERQQGLGQVPWGTLAYLAGGVVLFGVLIRTVGLLAASAAVVAFAGLPRWRARPVEMAVLTAGFAALAAAIFYYGLGMPFRLF